MCSSIGGQLGQICRAIEELAARSTSEGDVAGGSARAKAEGPARVQAEGLALARLAAIWEMVADADPELAKRLPGYLSAAE